MSKLSAFLNPVVSNEEKEVVISKRFVDEKGNPIPFRIRAITQAENDQIIKASKRSVKANGVMQEKLDTTEMGRRLVVEGTVYPDFRDSELCNGYSTMNPYEVPGKMLLAGEYSNLLAEINKLSGFDVDVEEEAKN